MDRFYKTTCPDRYDLLKEFAKKNRNNPTLAEDFMWKQLKGKHMGVKFIRQHAILDFIADFVCLEKKIIVEIDGEYHFTDKQKKEDETREERLKNIVQNNPVHQQRGLIRDIINNSKTKRFYQQLKLNN